MKLILTSFIIVFSLTKVISQNTILWSISDSSSNHISYLLGSYHQMGNSFIDSIPQIKKSLLSCDLSIFESLDNGSKVRAFLNKRNENFSYLNELKKSDLEFLESFAANWGVSVSKLTPMELLTKIQQEYFETQCNTIKPSDNFSQFDEYLIHLSKTNKINILGFENDSIQTANINQANPSGDWSKIKKPIHEWIENIKNSKHTDRYCQAAHNYIAMSFNYEFNVECGNDPMLKGRNEKWLEVLPSYLNNNNCFITVGLLHLFGKCGLIEQLREKGFTVTAVDLKLNK